MSTFLKGEETHSNMHNMTGNGQEANGQQVIPHQLLASGVSLPHQQRHVSAPANSNVINVANHMYQQMATDPAAASLLMNPHAAAQAASMMAAAQQVAQLQQQQQQQHQQQHQHQQQQQQQQQQQHHQLHKQGMLDVNSNTINAITNQLGMSSALDSSQCQSINSNCSSTGSSNVNGSYNHAFAPSLPQNINSSSAFSNDKITNMNIAESPSLGLSFTDNVKKVSGNNENLSMQPSQAHTRGNTNANPNQAEQGQFAQNISYSQGTNQNQGNASVPNSSQLALSAQAAAILAAGGLNPNIHFNQSGNVTSSGTNASATAQAFASLLQQQQQQIHSHLMQASNLTPSHNNVEAQLPSTQPSTQALSHQNVIQNNVDTSQSVLPQILSHIGTPSTPNLNRNCINHQAPSMQPSIPTAQSYHSIPSTSTSSNPIPPHTQTASSVPAAGFQVHGNFNSLPSTPQITPAPKVPVSCRPSVTSSPNTPNATIATAVTNTITSNKRRRSVAPSIRPMALSSSAGYAHNNERAGASGIYSTTTSNPMLLAHMQNWKLNQLEGHVQLLKESNQPIPQPVSLLLAEARRREEKRTAKRVANRKSACTSRARKKALVEEMTKANARLRRQAMILALLPDLVIVMKVDGEISFCSAQVEKVLRHEVDDLVGANIDQILLPSSRSTLKQLTGSLVTAEQAANENDRKVKGDDIDSANNGSVAIVSEQSDDRAFPLSVVKVSATAEDVSDSSVMDAGSRTKDKSFGQSTASSSVGNQNRLRVCVDKANETASSSGSNFKSRSASNASTIASVRFVSNNSCDDSSSSSDTKNFRKASEALNHNVRCHNAKLMSKKSQITTSSTHKDDVTGAYVTANNADARLSSLQHKPRHDSNVTNLVTVQPISKKSSNSSNNSSSNVAFANLEVHSSSSSTDSLRKPSTGETGANIENASVDSGYRESAESDQSSDNSSSSTIDNRSNELKSRPLAPTCNVCLIRNDLTTIWCEVTSSIQTRPLTDDTNDPSLLLSDAALNTNGTTSSNIVKDAKEKKEGSASNDSDEPSASSNDVVTELLLCLRPIRDGEEKVGQDLKFIPPAVQIEKEGSKTTDTNSSIINGADSGSNSSLSIQCTKIDIIKKQRPVKKRPLSDQKQSIDCNDKVQKKKPREGCHQFDTEKSVAESLLMFSHHTT